MGWDNPIDHIVVRPDQLKEMEEKMVKIR